MPTFLLHHKREVGEASHSLVKPHISSRSILNSSRTFSSLSGGSLSGRARNMGREGAAGCCCCCAPEMGEFKCTLYIYLFFKSEQGSPDDITKASFRTTSTNYETIMSQSTEYHFRITDPHLTHSCNPNSPCCAPALCISPSDSELIPPCVSWRDQRSIFSILIFLSLNRLCIQYKSN